MASEGLPRGELTGHTRTPLVSQKYHGYITTRTSTRIPEGKTRLNKGAAVMANKPWRCAASRCVSQWGCCSSAGAGGRCARSEAGGLARLCSSRHVNRSVASGRARRGSESPSTVTHSSRGLASIQDVTQRTSASRRDGLEQQRLLMNGGSEDRGSVLDAHHRQRSGLAVLLVPIPFCKVRIHFHAVGMTAEGFNDTVGVITRR